MGFGEETGGTVPFLSHNVRNLYCQHDLSLWTLTLSTWLRLCCLGFSTAKLLNLPSFYTVLFKRDHYACLTLKKSLIMLISWDKFPHTWWLTTIEMYSLSVLEAKVWAGLAPLVASHTCALQELCCVLTRPSPLPSAFSSSHRDVCQWIEGPLNGPEWSYLKILNVSTSAKTFIQNKLTATDCRWTYLLASHHSAHHTLLEVGHLCNWFQGRFASSLCLCIYSITSLYQCELLKIHFVL